MEELLQHLDCLVEAGRLSSSEGGRHEGVEGSLQPGPLEIEDSPLEDLKRGDFLFF
jgi:hypothetical protein